MSDRYFKCRQMFNDYLDRLERKELPSHRGAAANFEYANLQEGFKKKAIEKPIAEDEAEIFEKLESAKPILLKTDEFELKWFHTVTTGWQCAEDNDRLRNAKRLLLLFQKSSILENAVNNFDQLRVIYVFFQDEKEQPSERLFEILNHAFNEAMKAVTTFSDRVQFLIDLDLRKFMQDQLKAKRSLLEIMLRNPELIPQGWGGEFATLQCRSIKDTYTKKWDQDQAASKSAYEEMEKKRKEDKEKEKEKKRDADKEKEKEKKKEGEKAQATDQTRLPETLEEPRSKMGGVVKKVGSGRKTINNNKPTGTTKKSKRKKEQASDVKDGSGEPNKVINNSKTGKVKDSTIGRKEKSGHPHIPGEGPLLEAAMNLKKLQRAAKASVGRLTKKKKPNNNDKDVKSLEKSR